MAERRALLVELREIDHQAALDARLARHNTLRAFAAAARIMRADLPSARPVSHRDLQSGARAIRFPKPSPRSYSRAGVSYVHTQQTRDGLRHVPFHLRVTQCNHGGRAIAHQDYIERKTAVVAQIGSISDDPDERRDFWRQIAARATLRRGTIALPQEADLALRDALRPLLEAMEHDGKIPPRVAHAWLRDPRKPLVIRQLDHDQYEYAANNLAEAYRATVDDAWSTPHAAGKPPGLPPGFGAYPPRSPQIQRRMVLELPYELVPAARERILRNFCSRVFGARCIAYHAVIHAPAEGNDARNWHAHIVSTHHDIRRDPATGQWDFLAHDRLPPVHKFGQIITGNARGDNGKLLETRKERMDEMKGLFRKIREDFAAFANEELKLVASTRRYDARSYRDQGIDVTPAIHVGPGGTGIGKRGMESGRTPHQAAWMNVAASLAAALPEEDPDDIRDTLELEQIVQTLPAPTALFSPPNGGFFLALVRNLSTGELLDETVEALDRLPDPPRRVAVAEPDAMPQPIEIPGTVQRSPTPTAHALQEPPRRIAVAEPDVRPQRLPSPIQAIVRPSSAALGDAPGLTAVAEPDIMPQPIEIPGAVLRSPTPTAHALQEPPRRIAVAEPDVRPQRLPSPIQAIVRPSSAALGDAPGLTAVAEPDIMPQPIEIPGAVLRSPTPTAHALQEPPRRIAVAEPDVRPQRLPSPIQAIVRPSSAALGDTPGLTAVAEPDIMPQPIEIPGAVLRSPTPTAHALQEPPRRIAVAEPDVRPQRLPSPIQAIVRPSSAALGDAPGLTAVAEPDIMPQPIDIPGPVQRSPAPVSHSPAAHPADMSDDLHSLATELRPLLPGLGIKVIHAFVTKSRPDPHHSILGPRATERAMLTLAPYAGLHVMEDTSPSHAVAAWFQWLRDSTPRPFTHQYVRDEIPLEIARSIWHIHQDEQGLTPAPTPHSLADLHQLLDSNLDDLATASLVTPHFGVDTPCPPLAGLGPKATAAAIRTLRPHLWQSIPRRSIPNEPSLLLNARAHWLKSVDRPQILDDVASNVWPVHQREQLRGPAPQPTAPVPAQPRRPLAIQR